MKMGIYKNGDYNMKKKKMIYKKIILFIILFITIFFLFYYFINDNSKNYFGLNTLKNITQNLFKIKHASKYNKELIKEINNDYLREINNLKKVLDLNKLNSDKKLINSIVIIRSPLNYYNILTIDKGKKNNIKNNLAVINESGLIGKIINTNNSTSDVKLLISFDNKDSISATFKYKDIDYYGLIYKYNSNKNELYLKSVIGDFNKEEIKDINVVTSGLSNSFSSGLLIGKIIDIKKDTFGLSNIITIRPSVDFNNINIVSVVGDEDD